MIDNRKEKGMELEKTKIISNIRKQRKYLHTWIRISVRGCVGLLGSCGLSSA